MVTVLPQGVVEVEIGTLSSGQGPRDQLCPAARRMARGRERAHPPGDRRQRPHEIGAGSHSGRSIRLASISMQPPRSESLNEGCRSLRICWRRRPSDIDFADGRFTIKGTDRAVDLFTVAAAAEGDARVCRKRCAVRSSAPAMSSAASRRFPHGWHVAEVEVDPETGLVELARYTAIDDVGRAVNPMIIHGQTHGGIAQGMGQALMEHCIYDPESGQPLAGSFMDYAMPRADDLPFFATDISEVPSTTHPLGFRGGGEGGITPSLGVIVNAIVDALAEFGVTHVEMPATAEKVWRAMRAGRTASAGGTEAR